MTTDRTPAPEAGRFSSWLAGWRVALRMARRDVRHHRGRSLLVVVMVGLPVLLLTGGSTIWFTDDLNSLERLPFQLGQAEAYLNEPYDIAVAQDPLDPTYGRGPSEEPATPVPGYGDGTEAEALESLVGGDLVPIWQTVGDARVGEHWVDVRVVRADVAARAGDLSPRIDLLSGRWPRTPDEIVVTPVGVEDGLPTSGVLHLVTGWDSHDRDERDVTVVGLARAYVGGSGSSEVEQASLLGAPDPALTEWSRQWLLLRDEPMTWDEVQRLNEYGVGVLSRDVVEHADSIDVTGAPGYEPVQDAGDTRATMAVVAAATGLLLLTVLLAGPAFAVSAARQRRSLALAATNGATTPQLRRVVLAQALVLGALSALVGAALGVLGGIAVVLVTRTVRPDLYFGPLDVPWLAVVLVAGAAVGSTVVAALVPARGLGRLDIVPVLRGQAVSPRPRRGTPILGVVLLVASATAVVVGAMSVTGRNVWSGLVFMAGSVGLVVGTLMLVPQILRLGAHVSGRLPLPLRMAARDADRQRARTIPTVAAVLGAAAVLATVGVANEAASISMARDYQERTARGVAMLETGPLNTEITEVGELADLAVSRTPDVTSVVLHSLGGGDPAADPVQLVAQRPGCALEDTLPRAQDTAPSSEPPQPPASTACLTLATNPMWIRSANLMAAEPAALAAAMDLSDRQVRALEAGAVAILDPAEARGLEPASGFQELDARHSVDDLRPVDVDVDVQGMVTFARYKLVVDEEWNPVAPAAKDVTLVRMPTVLLSHDQWERIAATPYDGYGAVMSLPVARDLGLGPQPYLALLTAPGGIDAETEATLNDTLRSEYPAAQILVERGYQRPDGTMLLVVFTVIGLIMLVATLIATALGQAENAGLLGTLAAVGATRRTRRALAAGQAAYVGLLGAVVGIVVGLVPGIAVARVITANHAGGTADFSGSVAPVPWAYLVPTVLAVGLVAAALAWVAVRRAPTVTRRAT